MRRLHALRLGLGVLLTALFLATVGGLLYLQAAVGPSAEAATVHVRVLSRGGAVLHDAPETLAEATPLAALEAAARASGFAVRSVEYPNGRYVRAVAGEEAEGAAGWVYAVTRGGTATYPPAAADRYALEEGDGVLWRWTDRPLAPTEGSGRP